MGKKNSGEAQRTRTRSSKSTGKPSGRGFTGHRGRGRGRSIGGYELSDRIANEERPESAIDDGPEDSDDVEEQEDEDQSEGSFLDFAVLAYLTQHYS